MQAYQLGYIQTRGKEKGKVGSISRLMQAIAQGEVKISKAA